LVILTVIAIFTNLPWVTLITKSDQIGDTYYQTLDHFIRYILNITVSESSHLAGFCSSWFSVTVFINILWDRLSVHVWEADLWINKKIFINKLYVYEHQAYEKIEPNRSYIVRNRNHYCNFRPTQWKPLSSCFLRTFILLSYRKGPTCLGRVRKTDRTVMLIVNFKTWLHIPLLDGSTDWLSIIWKTFHCTTARRVLFLGVVNVDLSVILTG